MHNRDSSNRTEKLAARFCRAAAARPAPWLIAGRLHALFDRLRRRSPVFPHVSGSAADRKWMESIFDVAAAASPVARQALAWAAAQKVSVRVQAELQGSGAYDYLGHVMIRRGPHTDIVGVVGTLVHEIRHAWQDYYGLLGAGGPARSLNDRLIGNALTEADAYAFGELAKAECERLHGVRKPSADMGLSFRHWFRKRAEAYHRHCLVNHAAAAARTGKHARPSVAPVRWDVFIDKLGRGFDGRDYIAASGDLRDFIRREVLPRGRALAQFNAENPRPSPARAIDAQERKQRLRR